MVHIRNVDSFFEIPIKLRDFIKTEIGEDEDRLSHVENLIDQWTTLQPHLPNNYDRKMSRNFIRGAKFNLEVIKRKFEGYYLAKHAFPEFYQHRDPTSEEISKAFDSANIVRLPKLTQNGERICFMSLTDPDPARFDMMAAIKLYWMLLDLTLTSDHPTCGEVIIFDCTHFSSGHLVKFLSSSFKHAITILRDSYAIRVTQLHVINCPPMVEKIISAVKHLIPEKVNKRFTVHKGVDSLFNHLDAKELPADIGGDLESLRSYMQRWQEIAVSNTDWFRQQEKVNVAGTPPKKIEKFTLDVGVEGSFRQLNVD